MVKFVKKYWIPILIFIFGLSVSWPLMRGGYFSHQDDLHIIRIVEMRKCFSDFQIPCRWVPDMGWGNGMPLFNFYGVFTYYVGGIVSFFIGYLATAKFLFFVALTLGSYGIYLLVKDLWGKYAGLTSSILYLFAPYKALDIYVRGALTEAIALTIIPFVLYFGYKKNYKLFTLTLFLFLITHNIMTIIFLPVILLWMIYWNNLRTVIITFAIAFGLSSFFILPAFLEKGLVQTQSLTRFELDFRANFISIRQLFFDRVWGYGTSIPGPEGGMNFQIGWPHWLLVIVSVIYIFIGKFDKKTKFLVSGITGIFLLSIFMTHNKSSFIWEKFSILEYFQFPWRFLSLSILTSSILGGFVVLIVKEKFKKYLCALIIVITVILNWNYFKPREFYNINDTQKLSGQLWEEQRKGAILDYLPITALEPREAAPKLNNFNYRSNKFTLDVNIPYETQIEIPVYYFPNWEVTVNGKVYPLTHDNILGRISVFLPEGSYNVVGRFKNTALRTIANTITLLSVIGFILWKKLEN